MEVETKKAKVRFVGIVRDKDGNPRFDDPNNVPAEVLAALTQKDLEYLNTLRGKQ